MYFKRKTYPLYREMIKRDPESIWFPSTVLIREKGSQFPDLSPPEQLENLTK